MLDLFVPHCKNFGPKKCARTKCRSDQVKKNYHLKYHDYKIDV